MKQKMILLIQPVSKESGKLNYPPFGLMSVAALPDSRGEPVRIIDGNILSRKEIEAEIDNSDPSIVGFSTFTGPMLKEALELSRYVKARTKALVVWGGIHASLLPQQTIKEDCVDVVVVGEGDYVFYEIIQKSDNLEGVPGIIYKKNNGDVIENKPGSLIFDLDSLPPMPWHLIDADKYCIPWAGVNKTIPVISSRGCPFSCAFCYNKEFNKMKWRVFNLKRVFSEIDYLSNRLNIEGVRLDASDNFIGTDKPRAIEITRYLKSKGIKFSIQARVQDIDRAFLEELKNNGCGYIFFGLESGSPAMCAYLSKTFNTKSVVGLINYANKIGLRCGAGFVFDIPGETNKDFKMTRGVIKKINCLVQLNAVQPYPGTKLYKDIKDRSSFNVPRTTIEWRAFSWWKVHGFSKISNIRITGRLWRFKINYIDNLIVCLRKRDFFMIKTMISNLFKMMRESLSRKFVKQENKRRLLW